MSAKKLAFYMCYIMTCYMSGLTAGLLAMNYAPKEYMTIVAIALTMIFYSIITYLFLGIRK